LDGAARIAFYTPRLQGAQDLENEFFANIEMVPVAAVDHPLAHHKVPITRDMLEEQVQLVLTDRTQITAGFTGGVISRRIWRFADLGTRLEYLLAGFGWCNMPLHMVEAHIESKRLKQLRLADTARLSLPIHVIHQRSRPPGRAGRWLLDDLRKRLSQCPADGSVQTRAPR
jgi:DNA-binding transcriptional LysR family regulator